MPSLDFHALKLPSTRTKSKLSLPSVAQSIKHHISKNLPSRRASLAASEIYNAKLSNGDLRRRKLAESGDLCTMHEEDSEHEDSAGSSRATSESGDVFSRNSVSESIGSDRLFGDTKSLSRNNSESVEDERIKLAKIQEEAKRRHSESTIDRNKVSSADFHDIVDVVPFQMSGRRSTMKRKHSVNCDMMESSKGFAKQININHLENGSVIEDNADVNEDRNDTDSDDSDGDCVIRLSCSKQSFGDLSDNNNEGEKAIDVSDKKLSKSDEETNGIICTSHAEIHVENEIQNGTIKRK